MSKVRIVIESDVYLKTMHWVHKAGTNEVSGFGKVVHSVDADGTNVFRVIDSYLLKQEVAATTTEIDGESLALLMDSTRDKPGELRWWWHSHVRMQAFWSGTDKDTIKEYGKRGWLIATVFNQMEELQSALCYKTDSAFGKSNAFVDNVETIIEQPYSEDEVAAWDKEYTESVTIKEVVPNWKNYEPRQYTGDTNPNGNILDATKEKVRYDTPPSLVPSELSLLDPGYLGYGIEAEAKALGMTTEAYWRKLETASTKELSKIEDKLMYLEKKGKIHGHYPRTKPAFN